MPVTLVGANVNGKPNFLAVAFCGIMNPHPPTIYAALNEAHHTNAGIRENGAKARTSRIAHGNSRNCYKTNNELKYIE